MAKPKPDQIIRHEIVLGQTERNQLKDITSAYAFNRISSPIFAALGDPAFLLLAGGLLLFYIDDLLKKIGVDPADIPDLDGDDLLDWFDTLNLSLGGIGFLLGGLLTRSYWGAAAGATVGTGAAEAIEELQEGAGILQETIDDPSSTSVGQFGGLSASLIAYRLVNLKRGIESGLSDLDPSGLA